MYNYSKRLEKVTNNPTIKKFLNIKNLDFESTPFHKHRLEVNAIETGEYTYEEERIRITEALVLRLDDITPENLGNDNMYEQFLFFNKRLLSTQQRRRLIEKLSECEKLTTEIILPIILEAYYYYEIRTVIMNLLNEELVL